MFPLRYVAGSNLVPGFQTVIFRRTYKRITQAGGLEDESKKIYPLMAGRYNNTDMMWSFGPVHAPATIQFAHLQHETDSESWKGAQIALIAFEELTEFTEKQFFYIQSRNRSTCGVKPQTIATTNPDCDSWVKKFLAPWVDDEWPVDDRALSGETRYFVREGDNIRWLLRGERHEDATSVKFIFASVYDNPILLEKDKNYVKRLKSLPLVDRLRLLNGDWNARPEGGMLFRRDWFKVIGVSPAVSEYAQVVRTWDFAATEKKSNSRGDDPDFTATVKMARLKDGRFVILDARKFRARPQAVEESLVNITQQDGTNCIVALEQEPGSAGVFLASYNTRLLAGYPVKVIKSTGAKIERARPASSQVEAGNVLIVKGQQTDDFINDLEAFPNPHVHDDFVDAFSLAMSQLTTARSADDMLGEISKRIEIRRQREQTLAEAIHY